MEAESQASGSQSPPKNTLIQQCLPLIDDPTATNIVARAFAEYFKNRTEEMAMDSALVDSALLTPKGVPYLYWNVGCPKVSRWEQLKQEGGLSELLGNHSPLFAPMIEMFLCTGIEAIAIAALAFLLQEIG